MYLVKDKNTLSALGAEKYDEPPNSAYIIPGVLYPAVAGKLLDGSTSHSGAYGTAQADTFSYYYTDIKGSKPIKDPRIGAHFGCQRHNFRSMQLQEQETATHGEEVYTIDGREWMKAMGSSWNFQNGIQGVELVSANSNPADFIEIVGYFSHCNFLIYPQTNSATDVNIYIDGSDTGNDFSTRTALASHGGTRYVNGNMLVNLDLGSTTLGLHTLKIGLTSTYVYLTGLELIAQEANTDATCDYNDDPTITHDDDDGAIRAGMSVTGTGIPVGATVASVTSDTAFELSVATTGGSVTNGTLTFGQSNIQIPSQNVVSFGKKFTVSGTPHYDPFHGFVNDTSLFSAFVDMDTSLGLGTATTWGAAWDKGSDNHIRPYNGGRVVKWVDSSGNIKTSVNMMPANAQKGVGSGAHAEITTPSATNTAYLPAISDDTVEHSLAEVAKTFHWREFGNGAANAGTGAAFADASMLTTSADAIAYVMDDGLTSLSAPSGVLVGDGIFPNGASSYVYITFIGTGITIIRKDSTTGSDEHDDFIDGVNVLTGAQSGIASRNTVTIAQNLPYGTHIYAMQRTAVNAYNRNIIEATFHQPKMPPIPEDAVVIADYMLMADFVAQTAGELGKISKGVRFVSSARDHFIDATSGSVTLALSVFTHLGGYEINFQTSGGHSGDRLSIPAFGTNALIAQGNPGSRYKLFRVDGGSSLSLTSVGSGYGVNYPTANQTLGSHKFELYGTTTSYNLNYSGMFIVSPIHTSSHYQTFETPFLHELVGGDRNMEQTNLVVTPDGKTWDEVTRNTSYIGSIVHLAGNNAVVNESTFVIMDDRRGQLGSEKRDCITKDFAIAYDRDICLRNGQYAIHAMSVNSSSGSQEAQVQIFVNGTRRNQGHGTGSGYSHAHTISCGQLKRGDYVQIKGGWYSNHQLNGYWIERI